MLLTGNDTVKEIKLFGLGAPLLKRYQELFTRFYEEDRAIAKQKTVAGLGWGLLSNLAYYGSYAWIVLRTVAGRITLGDMTMFLTIFRQSQGSIRSLLDSLNRLYESNLFLDNLVNYLELEPSLTTPADGRVAPAPLQHGIEFKHVTFRYPGCDADVLGTQSPISARESTCVVGLNGARQDHAYQAADETVRSTEGEILLDARSA